MDSAQTLYDFALDLLSDEQAQAAFAADPQGALAAAGLGDLDATDVQEILPLVLDYLPTRPGLDELTLPDQSDTATNSVASATAIANQISGGFTPAEDLAGHLDVPETNGIGDQPPAAPPPGAGPGELDPRAELPADVQGHLDAVTGQVPEPLVELPAELDPARVTGELTGRLDEFSAKVEELGHTAPDLSGGTRDVHDTVGDLGRTSDIGNTGGVDVNLHTDALGDNDVQF
ncbi:IniB N-terminal domain-containing protein [Amycolatopsis nigrescens]|uniref:IniB N-terminal domain-containing protein n=1 Tax=Amycolatopsis nigrescens TaxID=381445 RepID=UPI0003A42DA9|nr:IniB N-terminal domain-containing protein [Amycolatopsis nigrescens]